MKHSSFDATISALDAETSALDAETSVLDVETSAFGAATSVIARRSFDVYLEHLIYTFAWRTAVNGVVEVG